MADENGNGLIKLDRSLIKHKEAARWPLLNIMAERAQRDLDVETAAALLQEMDDLMAKVVVSVPDGWLPKGVKVGDPGWLGELSEENYQKIVEEGRARQPGEKKP